MQANSTIRAAFCIAAISSLLGGCAGSALNTSPAPTSPMQPPQSFATSSAPQSAAVAASAAGAYHIFASDPWYGALDEYSLGSPSQVPQMLGRDQNFQITAGIDYDATSGTLAVSDMEARTVTLYRQGATISTIHPGGNPFVVRYDHGGNLYVSLSGCLNYYLYITPCTQRGNTGLYEFRHAGQHGVLISGGPLYPLYIALDDLNGNVWEDGNQYADQFEIGSYHDGTWEQLPVIIIKPGPIVTDNSGAVLYIDNGSLVQSQTSTLNIVPPPWTNWPTTINLNMGQVTAMAFGPGKKTLYIVGVPPGGQPSLEAFSYPSMTMLYSQMINWPLLDMTVLPPTVQLP